MALTKEKALVYQLMVDVVVKFALGMAVFGAFVAITVKIIIDPTWPAATFGGFLSVTVVLVFRHYFPAKKK